MHHRIGLACVCLLACLAAGCGPKKEMVTGIATYERVPVTDHGLDYAAVQTLPIAGARVVVMQGDQIAAETVTGQDGSFSLKIADGATMRLGVLAEDGSRSVQVVDGGGAVWGVYRDVQAGAKGLMLRATTGWTGTAYDPVKRTSGPFAIYATLR
jgi:hypothetical protein